MHARKAFHTIRVMKGTRRKKVATHTHTYISRTTREKKQGCPWVDLSQMPSGDLGEMTQSHGAPTEARPPGARRLVCLHP
jgi:hypothetical protein